MGKFGRIRLGEGADGGAGGKWVQGVVVVVSAVVAVVAATPLLVGSLWRSARGLFGGGGNRGGGIGRYTTRSSFARGRGDYAVVDADEDELLGEEEDEEV